nr:hypothetical protein [Tanacetum cinerariifolium]
MCKEVFLAKGDLMKSFYDDEEYSIQYKEYLENSSDAIAPVLPTEEPEYSLSMSDEDAFEDIEYVEALLPDSKHVGLEEENDSFASILIFEESDNSLSNNSSPEFETFSYHTEETRSGSTTTHANNSLLEYDLFCFEIEPNSGEVILVVINDIDELNEDECFDPGGEIDVFIKVEDDDYCLFIFFIRIFLPYLIFPKVSPLLLSAGSEDTIFDPGISA